MAAFFFIERQPIRLAEEIAGATEIVDAGAEESDWSPASLSLVQELQGSRDEVGLLAARRRRVASGHRREIGITDLDGDGPRQQMPTSQPPAQASGHLSDLRADPFEIDKILWIGMFAP